MDNREKLLAIAKENLGKDLVPMEDSLACAGTVNALHKKAFGKEIGGGLSTYQMYQVLKVDPRFEKTLSPLPGDICISPTGMSSSKKIRNGHVGIVMEGEKIASNNSLTGLFEINYTFASWRKRWVNAKYPMDFFRVATPVAVNVPAPIPLPVEEPKTLMPMWMKFMLDRATMGFFEPALGMARSPQWHSVRKAYLKDHPECAVCGKRGTLLNPLNVHHKKLFNRFPALELSFDNLIVLCRDDHFLFGHLRGWSFQNDDIEEDVKIWNNKLRNRT